MKEIEEIKEILNAHKGELKERFGVKEIGIFGSYIKGTQKDINDLDILVEFESPIDFFTFLELEEFLTELLEVKVDQFIEDEKVVYAGIRCFEIISEAVKKIASRI
ncbi:MAG: nucleotidyltransferase domain-containing protein [Nanopusillaceae archaeon]